MFYGMQEIPSTDGDEETRLAVNRMLLLLLKSDIKGPKLTIIPQESHWSQHADDIKLVSSRFQTVAIESSCLNYSASTINRALKYFGKFIVSLDRVNHCGEVEQSEPLSQVSNVSMQDMKPLFGYDFPKDFEESDFIDQGEVVNWADIMSSDIANMTETLDDSWDELGEAPAEDDNSHHCVAGLDSDMNDDTGLPFHDPKLFDMTVREESGEVMSVKEFQTSIKESMSAIVEYSRRSGFSRMTASTHMKAAVYAIQDAQRKIYADISDNQQHNKGQQHVSSSVGRSRIKHRQKGAQWGITDGGG